MEAHENAKFQNHTIKTHSKGTWPRFLKTHLGLNCPLGVNPMKVH